MFVIEQDKSDRLGPETTNLAINTIAGKITECWLVKEESIFFWILLREEGKTRSPLVLRSPSKSSFNREVVYMQQWRLVSR